MLMGIRFDISKEVRLWYTSEWIFDPSTVRIFMLWNWNWHSLSRIIMCHACNTLSSRLVDRGFRAYKRLVLELR
jgi:hypothetical protein